ncbi:hypothetical protein [Maribacter sp. 4G9]|uniref:hypothetical protein n=1 Tax=Maribacter sp. 4G9 TaxID=1889777 RepID=UPI000C15D054|nr:hypothetical protein [Maribacter sp. 4G9]PIB23378.1 hypothetical protein BFP75_10245 [Maribacter sp. 4G9]
MSNVAYSSKKVFKKAIFNIGFQIVPIAAALLLTPYLIENMGKDFWAKYSTGISLVFLSNYFSFGIGPTLNRRISQIIGLKQNHRIQGELRECVSFSYLLGIAFFVLLQVALYVCYVSESFSILQTKQDYLFYFIVLCVFFLSFLIIPYKSLLESFSDFYFLAIVRALTAAMLFLVPFIYIYFYTVSLTGISTTLLSIYVLLYLLYFLRAKSYEAKLSFNMVSPVNWEMAKGIFKFELSFLKETIWFSVFFATSAIVLFFDRFYYPLFFDTRTISDHVTLLDLFNRVAIVTGTISLVYFSAISVWYQENNLHRVTTNLKLQLVGVGFLFLAIGLFSYFFLNDILHWWLKSSYSNFIEANGFRLLIGTLLVNFTILMIRPLQAIGEIKKVSLWLMRSTFVYLTLVLLLGAFYLIEYHFMAFIVKALIDVIILVTLLRRKKIL